MSIRSWEIIELVYGMLTSPRMNVTMDNWKHQWAAYILSGGMTILLLRYHNPMVSKRMNIIKLNPIMMMIDMENVFLSRSMSPRPSSNVSERPMEDVSELDTRLNIATNPPTTLYIPKSVTPNALRIIRDVNNPITIMTIIRKYNATAFFAIFLLFVTSCDI